MDLKALGNKVNEGDFAGLEAIELTGFMDVFFTADEVTALCPVTRQPDFYTIQIRLLHTKYTIESKSLKLYFHRLRDRGIFAEDLAKIICDDVADLLPAEEIIVEIEQKSRGGISIGAKCSCQARS